MSLDVWLTDENEDELYWGNITHNLNTMAEKAGIYKAMWRPEEIGATKAKDISDILQKGLNDMIARPEYYEQFNSPNGWGLYEHFVPFVRKYLKACLMFPEAKINVSR